MSEILLGYDISTNPPTPIWVSRDFLSEGHIHIRGRTRSGKTSRAILPLATQLMQPYSQGGVEQRDPIIIIDLGGDQALFYFIKEYAERMGRRFRFLSLHPEDDWDFMDPFQAVPAGQRDVIQQVTLLIRAFNLDHGLVYGGLYFTQANLAALLRAARKLSMEEGRRLTLHDVANYLEREARHRRIKDADQIRMTFDFLLEYPQLAVNEHTDRSRCIEFDRAIQDSEVLYFYTPTIAETSTARQVAGLALFNLLFAAIERARRGRAQRKIWVFIDEFHELVGRSFDGVLAQGAKYGLSLVMANQTTGQLESRDVSLHESVFDNTGTKIYFTATCTRDKDDLQGLSCDDPEMLPGRSTQHLSTSSSEHAVLLPRLNKNEILDTSATAGHAFVILDNGQGHREPIRAELPYFIEDRALYQQVRRTPLPRRPVAKDMRAATDAAAKRSALSHEIRKAVDPVRRAKMLKMLGRKRLAEQVESGTP